MLKYTKQKCKTLLGGLRVGKKLTRTANAMRAVKANRQPVITHGLPVPCNDEGVIVIPSSRVRGVSHQLSPGFAGFKIVAALSRGDDTIHMVNVIKP